MNRQDGKYTTLNFMHKSVSDWLTDDIRSGIYYVDKRHGALLLARFCRQYVDDTGESLSNKSSYLLNYAREHIGVFYVLGGSLL